MLGEQIYEHKGKITSQRVLHVSEQGPKLEISLSANGKFIGKRLEVTETVIYWSIFRPGGLFYGQGQGVLMTKDGSGEMATITPQGVGRFINQGQNVSIRGSVFFHSPSMGKLAFLNGLVGIFEYEADEAGNTIVKVWEWK